MDVIFQASDLAGAKRRDFLDAAREGRAHLRDTDGTDLVALRARDLTVLEQLARWSNEHRRLSVVLNRTDTPSVADLGEHAWLRVFDRDDILGFLGELQDVLIAAFADNDMVLLDDCVRAWRVSAQQLQDPLRRAVLTARHDPTEFRDGGEE